ncbi:hypothetical protein FKW77_005582 [Venturia effusa]|uniref:Swi5-domain-containing protein n=1 Tax=Venturia effusa TaxID=50376 RepID=A0A517L3C2_9PEZI|nr:hypothetical protein FKW77_005582 [Venturia effusa]
MESSMADEASTEKAQPISTPQKQGNATSREIADSDAEDDAMDIDDEKPRQVSAVTSIDQDLCEDPIKGAGSHALHQTQELDPSSPSEPAHVSINAREASYVLGLDADDGTTDKSLEPSEIIAHSPHEEADPEHPVVQVKTTELLFDNEHRTNSNTILEGLEQMQEPDLQASFFKSDGPSHPDEHTKVFMQEERAEPLAAKAESFRDTTTSEWCEGPVQALKGSNTLGETVLSDGMTISHVPTNDVKRCRSPNTLSAEDLILYPSTTAAEPVPGTSQEIRDGAHSPAQDQNKLEAIPDSSISDRAINAPGPAASEQSSQPEASSLKTPQAEQTPEQKRMANLRSRNTALTQTLTSLSQQRNALLHSLSAHLSPYTLADIPSVLKPYRGKIAYTPSTAAHMTPLPAPITPEDDAKLMAEARQAIKDHIGRLHRYNEIRDVGQGLIGMIADQRGKRIVDCMDEFGVEVGD